MKLITALVFQTNQHFVYYRPHGQGSLMHINYIRYTIYNFFVYMCEFYEYSRIYFFRHFVPKSKHVRVQRFARTLLVDSESWVWQKKPKNRINTV